MKNVTIMILFGNEVNPMNDIVEEIQLIKKLGFDFAEITIESPFNLPEILEIRKSEIKKVLKFFSRPPLAHFTWEVELGAVNEDVRKYWVKEAKIAMKTASDLGCTKFTVHYTSSIYFVGENQTLVKKILDNYIKSLKELVKFANTLNIQLMLENAALERREVHLKNFSYIIDNVPGLKVNIDISHAFLSGGMQLIADFIKHFGKKIIHLHFSDNSGRHDEHLSIGNGKINYEKVVEMIKEINYDDSITFEIFEPPRSNARKSMMKIRKLFS